MKSTAVLLIVLFSCSESDDPKPQVSCAQLKGEIEAVQKSILEHQAKGNEGNQSAWESELKRLNDIKTIKSNEYTTRHC